MIRFEGQFHSETKQRSREETHHNPFPRIIGLKYSALNIWRQRHCLGSLVAESWQGPELRVQERKSAAWKQPHSSS